MNQYENSGKASFIIYADIERIIERIHGCKINPKKSFTAKVSENILFFPFQQYLHLEA